MISHRPVDDHVANRSVHGVEDDGGGDDGDDHVAGRAEQVATEPVTGPGSRWTLGLRRRYRHRLGRDGLHHAQRSTIARRRLMTLTTREISSDRAR